MLITTKFDLGDSVVPIRRRSEPVTEPCPVCEGAGNLALVKGGTTLCTNYMQCRGGKIHVSYVHPWTVDGACRSRVGKISVERYAEPDTRHESRLQYMIAATGVGSGTMWSESDLFATDEEARAECDARNGSLATVEG